MLLIDRSEKFIREHESIPVELILKLHGDSGTVVQDASIEKLQTLFLQKYKCQLEHAPAENKKSYKSATFDASLYGEVQNLQKFMQDYNLQGAKILYDSLTPYIKIEFKTGELIVSSTKNNEGVLHLSRIKPEHFSVFIAGFRGPSMIHFFITDIETLSKVPLTKAGEKGKEFRIFSHIHISYRVKCEDDIIKQMVEKSFVKLGTIMYN